MLIQAFLRLKTLRGFCLQVRILFLLAGFALVSCKSTSLNTSEQPALTLVRDRKAQAVIVIPAKPTLSEITAAKELGFYLELMSGTALVIRKERAQSPGVSTVYIGHTEYAKGKQLIPQGKDSWSMTTVEGNLVLVGGDSRGTLYSVFHLLEDELGVRWWTPWEEHVPHYDTVSIRELHCSGKPAFEFRNSYVVDNPPAEFKKFAARNRLNGDSAAIPASFGGAESYGPDWQGKKGSGIFQMAADAAGGKAGSQQKLNCSDISVQKMLSQKIRDLIIKTDEEVRKSRVYKPTFYHISPSVFGDSGVENSYMSTSFMQMLNEVSATVSKLHPHVRIETWAYGPYLLPSDIELNPNVAVFVDDLPAYGYWPVLTKPVTDANHMVFQDAVEAWGNVCKNVYVVEFLAPFVSARGLPVPAVQPMKASYQYYRKNRVKGIFSQTGLPVGGTFFELKLWVQAKLMENPDLDADQLINEFIDGYYGKAAGPVRKYLEKLQNAVGSWPVSVQSTPDDLGYLTPEFLMEMAILMEQAEDDVAGDKVLVERVKSLKASLDYAMLMKWREICLWHLARGGTAENLPLSQDELSQEYSAALVNGFRKWYKGNALKRKMIWMGEQIAPLKKIDGFAP